MKTSITSQIDHLAHVRGYKITEMMQKLSFTEAAFLTIAGDKPSKEQAELFNTLLVSAVDHGPGPLYTQNARNSASAGATTAGSIAAGVLGVGDYNGGAVEGAATIFETGVDKRMPAEEIVDDFRSAKRRMPGYGHKIYKDGDPRTQVIREKAKKLKLYKKHFALADAIEAELENSSGKRLPLNIDGAFAAALLELGFKAEGSNAFFILARVPGLIAHIFEEMQNPPVSRRMKEESIEYTGDKPRKL